MTDTPDYVRHFVAGFVHQLSYSVSGEERVGERITEASGAAVALRQHMVAIQALAIIAGEACLR
jgi:hypothetical protein